MSTSNFPGVKRSEGHDARARSASLSFQNWTLSHSTKATLHQNFCSIIYKKVPRTPTRSLLVGVRCLVACADNNNQSVDRFQYVWVPIKWLPVDRWAMITEGWAAYLVPGHNHLVGEQISGKSLPRVIHSIQTFGRQFWWAFIMILYVLAFRLCIWSLGLKMKKKQDS